MEISMKTTNMAILALCALALSPLALAQNEEDGAAEKESEERVCVNARSVRTFDAFTDEHVYVREGSNEHFLMTMQNRCHNLRNAQGIAFKNTTSRICSDGFGELAYRDGMGSMARLATCRIDTIERVESKEDAEAIVDARDSGNDD
jgi:hypothetical protein